MSKFVRILHQAPYFSKNKLIYLFGIVILFFALFDGIVSYLVPLVITQSGLSNTSIGIILSSAAVSGAFFNFTIYKIFKNSLFRRLFVVMFAVALVYLMIIWNANSFWLYILAMILWGFYYDLKIFGIIDFTCRYFPKEELIAKSGNISVFQSLGYLLAPLIAGFLVFNIVDNKPFYVALLFLIIAVIFFILLIWQTRKTKQLISEKPIAKSNFLKEFSAWKKTGKAILPILLLGAFYTIIDSFFMTLGPLVAESLPLEPFDGIFMFAYLLPALIMGNFVGKITNKFGAKNSIVFGLLIGAFILSFFYFFKTSILIPLIIFIAFCFISIIYPIIQGLYAQYIRKFPSSQKETQELGNFSENVGFIIGPIIAGVIADRFGISATFSILGMIGFVFAILLIFFMPKKI